MGELKQKCKKLYNSIRSTNFIHILRDMDFKRSIKMISKGDKIKNLSIAISIVGVNLKDVLLDDNALVDI